MTQQDYTHIALVIDRSGSMSTIKKDADGGVAQFIKDQQAVNGKCTVSLFSFDHEFQTEKDFTDIQQFGEWEIVPRGSTALLDAFGRAITSTGERLAALQDDERPEHVVFVVVTDGQENSSKEWRKEKVLEAIQHQTERYGWTFVYLAANQDAIAEARGFGIPQGQAINYNERSARDVYAVASASTSSLRSGGGYTSMPDHAPEDAS